MSKWTLERSVTSPRRLGHVRGKRALDKTFHVMVGQSGEHDFMGNDRSGRVVPHSFGLAVIVVGDRSDLGAVCAQLVQHDRKIASS
jgi:hypothetical protein